jgi:hypothetical protein
MGAECRVIGSIRKKFSKKKHRALKAIPLRIILLKHPDGTTSILFS